MALFATNHAQPEAESNLGHGGDIRISACATERPQETDLPSLLILAVF
jgi:hypothetical protein